MSPSPDSQWDRNSPRTALFRCDASVRIGAGHVARCLTLAKVLDSRGWHCRFAVGIGSTAAVPDLAGWDYLVLSETANNGRDAAELASHILRRVDLLVVDHYDLDADFESSCRSFAEAVLAIDDLANRRHDCDIILDQSLDRAVDDYRPRVPETCRVLVGPEYALVADSFPQCREDALARRDDSQAMLGRILISLGRMDGRAMIPKILDAVEASGVPAAIDIAVSAAAPAIAELRRRSLHSAGAMTVHEDTDDMATLMQSADIMIGTPGSTSWERCCLGLPGLLIVLADNQVFNGQTLEKAGAAIVLDARNGEVPMMSLIEALQALRDGNLRRGMAHAAEAICDGRGAHRVAVVIEDVLAPNESEIGKAIHGH